MSQSLCAYCKQPGLLTREHLWPAGLHRRLCAADRDAERSFWLARLRRDIPAEPQIRDVCQRCNNITLSELDSYICQLFDSTLCNVVQRGERVDFTYDYHRLKRWMLKMSFNSARIHNSVDREALEALVPYMLDGDERSGRSAQLFVQLTYPEKVNKRELDPTCDPQEHFLFEPRLNRVGHMLFRAQDVGQKLLRAVHLCSYNFFIAYWHSGGGRFEQHDFEMILTRYMTGTRLLRPSQKVIRLDCIGAGAWESFRGSRDTEIAFDLDTRPETRG